MKVLDLFSGIGGFSLGLERAGFETVAFCEIEPFCQKVLKKHWPNIPIYSDVRELTRERLDADGIFPDVITGGFPCQDISLAGKQAGIEGERSGLWSECARMLGEFRPRYAIFENVTALLSGERGKWFERVLWDISQVGYDAEWHCIPASAIGANHQRDRVWIVCYPNNQSKPIMSINDEAPGLQENATNPARIYVERHNYRQGQGELRRSDWWEIEPKVDRVVDGLSPTMDELKSLGNAVVPQIPELIGRAIMKHEKIHT